MFMSITFCTHYINKALHQFTIALCVYITANAYSILLNQFLHNRYLFTLGDQLLHLYFDVFFNGRILFICPFYLIHLIKVYRWLLDSDLSST